MEARKSGILAAAAVAIVVVTSRRWLGGAPKLAIEAAGNIRRLASVCSVLAYLQILFGAVLRHVPVDAQPATFMHAVRSHLVLAAILAIHILLLAGLVFVRARNVQPLARLTWALVGLIGLQVVLGASTWVVKFAVPAWAAGWISTQPVAVQDGGWLQTHIITAHVATGSLILATSVALAQWSRRLLADAPAIRSIFRRQLEAAV